ncbi:hypothetical protein C2S51_017244 [Perilla frutescens var. frutescens]|nr:hypothetical protein C2S51_017244 [Perilla frutescens var. frutescens]
MIVIRAQGGENEGKSVDDQNMIVLRMRIKKMKVIESGEGAPPPPSSEWKEWERMVFTHYHEGVCDSVEMLQVFLMNTRPSVAVGMLALIAMAIPN